MSGLPREILRWMESLDLSYSVTNVRRDFANGFLVAEIFNRYFKNDVHMHSYQPVHSLSGKKNNWQQLQKFFKRIDFQVDEALINDVIHAKAGASVELMIQVYAVLTSRTARPSAQPKHVDEKDLPAFMRSTASRKVRQRMREPDMVEKRDIRTAQKLAIKVVEQHDQSMREERARSPGRFTHSPIQRGPTRQLAEDDPNAPRVMFTKEVHVKQINDNIRDIRASRSQQGHRSTSSTGASRSSVGSRSSASGAGAAGVGAAVSGAAAAAAGGAAAGGGVYINDAVQPVMTTLNEVAAVKFPDDDDDDDDGGSRRGARSGRRKDAVLRVLDNVDKHSDEAVADMFVSCYAQPNLDALAQACLASPKEFWALSNICINTLSHVDVTSRTFQAVVMLLRQVGQVMIAADFYVPWALFSDFSFDKMLDVIVRTPDKSARLVQVMYSFCVPDVEEHVKVIRKLKESVDDSRVLLQSLRVLVTLESEINQDLMDLYLYYVLWGLKQPSPSLRATALGILAAIVPHNECGGVQAVLNLTGRLTDLAEDTQFEVRTQLLRVVVALLRELHPDDAGALYPIVKQVLTPNTQALVLRRGLLAIVPCLTHHRELRPLWISLVLQFPDVRRSLLNADAKIGSSFKDDAAPTTTRDDDKNNNNSNNNGSGDNENAEEDDEVKQGTEAVTKLSLNNNNNNNNNNLNNNPNNEASSATGAGPVGDDVHEMDRLTIQDVCHPLTIAQIVAEHVISTRPDNLGPGHVDLLAACLDGVREFPAAEVAEWEEVFTVLRDFLVVELVEPSLCEAVVLILRRFLYDQALGRMAISILVLSREDREQSRRKAPPMFGILKLVYSADGKQVCQKAVYKLLYELVEKQPGVYMSVVYNLLKNFVEFQRPKYEASPLLQQLVKYLEDVSVPE